MFRDHMMDGYQWPPPLTPRINQQDISSSYLYDINTSGPMVTNKHLHQEDFLSDNNQLTGDLEIDWVHLLSQAGCSSSSSNVTKPNHQNLLHSLTSSKSFCGEDQGTPNPSNDVRKVGRKVKKVVPTRVAFHTRSPDDILDDGYKWRKYGQKTVKNCNYPRSYYHCTRHTCNVKKQIQRLSKDPEIVVTTYDGIHNHPCEQFMEALTPLLNQIQFLTKF